MSNFVLDRDYTHRSTLGHIITFKAGDPVWVPPLMHREVAQIGAKRVDGKGIKLLDDETPEVEPLTADDRRKQLFAAFELIKERNTRSDFTGQGLPSIPALRKIIDFDLEKKEVEAMWREFENQDGE